MKLNKFRWAILTTIISLFLLILAGSIVRTTGSGLGCPDWPHCFGQWIPPTDVSQLPVDYKEKFAVAGRQIADFDATKTWIEYINRLLGVLVGLEMIWLMLTAWPHRKVHPALFKGSVFVFILTSIQGGIGAKVVSSHLAPHLITFHMFLAVVILLIAIGLYIHSLEVRKKLTIRSNRLGLIVLGLALIQLILGTEVREGVDAVTNAGVTLRSEWLDQESLLFMIHRSFSIFYLIVFGLWIGQLWKEEPYPMARKFIVAVFLATLLAPLSGIILAYFSMPAFAQPLHLFIATLIISGDFVLIYRPGHAPV
ncbi:MAG: heme A synthase [Bdellovibrionales bacterium CG12_big_fil_rev_8_21_14_0_65_38_15]|nr:MAG: heme A synthase [Bdellovibrionales bacterium CG22_combo_CG10-13_8_21_14_all_38_13]PIQ56900.1 MAG: heme A synthase [Bdellovibrionales bacterium CG12_big_fil_rev_8_21_14_0_65_38_15]PIR30065.1 MAG: heme A synthase [Bdellovibrionales bacterium CG11_big_fil_rev_8_21_14_0_20_38_13]